MQELLKKYQELKPFLSKRIKDFEKIRNQPEETLFAELSFCLCTPQSKARACDKALQELVKTKLLYTGNEEDIKQILVKAGVRFHHNKSRYIINARELFKKNSLKEIVNISNPIEQREWLVTNVKGLGYKEASHFLRNAGIHQELCILDRHILKNLVKYKAIKRIPETLTKKKYFAIEKKMKTFAQQVNIPCQELDLLFWAAETGEIFK